MKAFVLATLLCAAMVAAAQTHAPQLPAPGTRPSLDTIDSFRMVRLEEPIYPVLARQGRIQGTVHMAIQLVGCQGSTVSVRGLSGHPMLTAVALGSAQNSSYECENGRLNASGELIYDFRIDTKCHDNKTTSRIVDSNRVSVKACVAAPTGP
jgi:hypothetical protein